MHKPSLHLLLIWELHNDMVVLLHGMWHIYRPCFSDVLALPFLHTSAL